jgi:hypothetical protein
MAKKKPAKKAAAAKKKTAKRTSTTKKAAAKSPRKAAKPARKAAGKTAAKKAAPKAAKKAAPKAAAKKAAPKAAAKKAAVRKVAVKKATAKAAARTRAPKQAELLDVEETESTRPMVETERPDEDEVVETTSAGIQRLAPEHAAVDDLTSSGNELLDIFQKYDRNRTGSIEQAEFARLLEALGQNITDEELAIAFDIIDTDRTGKISWKQFKNWWTSR